MNKIDVIVSTNFNFKISLWQAIKLRIAGKNLKPIVEEILKSIVSKINLTKDE